MTRIFLFSLTLVLGLFLQSCANDSQTETAEAESTPMAATPDAAGQNAQPAIVQPDAPTGPTTNISFKKVEHDFGTLKDGDIARHEYAFTNTGTEPLIISNVKAGCGCTAPSWPKEPIAPGADGKILVEFDTKGKPGPQTKNVTVYANTELGTHTLTIKGLVEPKG